MEEVEKKETKKKNGLLKIGIAVAVIGVGIFLANYFGLVDFLTNIEAMQTWFNGLGLIGYVVYLLLYIVVAVFMIPASIFTIAGGIVFGSIAGGVLSVLGGTLGATVAFIVAKYIARDSIEAKFKDNPLFKKIDNGVKENGTSFLILTRLVPIFPYNVQNYAYGCTSMNVVTFALVSFITMAPGAFIYAFMAGEIVTNGVSVKLLVQFAIAGIILFLISLIPKAIAKKKGIKIEA